MYQRTRIYTKNLLIRVTETDLVNLDLARGDLSRSGYLRGLIPIPEVADEPKTNGRGASTRTPDRRPGRPDPNPFTVVGRHLHHYKKQGEPVRYHQGSPLYLYRCECGDTKEDT